MILYRKIILSAVVFTIIAFIPCIAFAVPDISGLTVTDVTPSSFSMVWMSDISGNPSIQVFTDSGMQNSIAGQVVESVMPSNNSAAAQAALGKGIMKVTVSGLSASTVYYARAVDTDPANPASVGYSPLTAVTTSVIVQPYQETGSGPAGYSNDLASFSVYIQPSSSEQVPGLGDLVMLQTDGSRYPVSVFAGDGINAPEGLVDLNNLFDSGGVSLDLHGGERAVITIYRGGMLSTLTHYRLIPQNGNMVYIVEPQKGFYADINLDGNVDEKDFDLFKGHYGESPDDSDYNPDYKFATESDQSINVRDFSMFSSQFGRTDVH